MFKQLGNKKTQKKIWVVLTVAIVFSFLFWGSSSVMRSQSDLNFAGKIHGRKVSLMDYRNALNATRAHLLIQLGDNFFKLENMLNLEGQAWDRIILVDEANRRKIKVTDREVIELVQSYPFFQENSKFDLEIYERLLKFMFYTQPRAFEEQVRDSLKINKLYESITSGVKLMEEQIKSEYKKENEEAAVDYISALYLDFVSNVELPENEIESYFKNNTLEFKKPDSFNLAYLHIPYPADAKETDIKAVNDKIQSLYLKVRGEKDIAKIAKEASVEVKETGFFGLNDPIPGIGWSPEIIAALSKLKINQASLPIYTSKGWYFVSLKEKKDSYIPTFAEIKDKVKEKITQMKSKEIAKKKIEDALSKIKDMYKIEPQAIDFGKLAKEFGLKSGETKPFKRASYIPGIGDSDVFFQAIANKKLGEISQILGMEQGFYIIRLKEWKGIDEERYLKEKTDFSKKVLALYKEQVFSQFVERLKQAANLQNYLVKERSVSENR